MFNIDFRKLDKNKLEEVFQIISGLIHSELIDNIFDNYEDDFTDIVHRLEKLQSPKEHISKIIQQDGNNKAIIGKDETKIDLTKKVGKEIGNVGGDLINKTNDLVVETNSA